jgi:sialate O-acetylesterase
MMKKQFLTLFFSLLYFFSFTQDWHGREAAVVLTYDDALNVHLDKVIPALDSFRLKGTFFLTAAARPFTSRLKEWKKAAMAGHELANHTLFHPCNGQLPGRSFVSPEYDLTTYTLRRVREEIRMTNTVLEALDGRRDRTFAYPCGDTRIGDSAYLRGLEGDFVAARGVQGQMVPGQPADYYNIGSYMINGQTGAELVALVEKARSSKSLVVFLFHGVGGEHGLNVSTEAHSILLRYLGKQRKKVWTTTFREAARYMKSKSRK